MSVEMLCIIVFGLFFFLLAIGFPAAMTMFAVGVIGYLLVKGPAALYGVAVNTFTAVGAEVFLAIPMFILMAQVFEHSGIGADMFNGMYRWFGGLRGGLGMAVIVIGALLSCVTGLIATATVLMGLIAYPQMMKKGYDKRLAIGTVMAAGILGPIIPPSLPMIIIGMMSQVSIGKLFIAGIVPGFLSALLFCVYVAIVCYHDHTKGPVLPKEERGTFNEKFVATRGLILPVLLAIVVLGGIFAGAFTATEAASVGAIGAILCMAVRGRFNMKNLSGSVLSSVIPFGMVMWIIMGGTVFSSLISYGGIAEYLGELILGWNLPPNTLVMILLIVVLIEGLALDLIPVAYSNLPIFIPIINQMGIDPLWFVFLFTVANVIGFMTPPFGPSLFFFLGLKHPGVTTGDVFIASIPWTIILVLVLFLCALVPGTVTFLPNLMIK
ncbi:MAG: TRAP transporter large permease subunit [Dehalococcoidales bacterium]|nr:TRAP transporter large permease subunit [Dehalococcoidales bacterium]